MKSLSLVILISVACTNCSAFVDERAASTTYRVLLASVTAAQRQGDVELARDAMPAGLLQLQAFALAYPSFRGFRELYADASCQYATAFVFDQWEDAMLGERSETAERIAGRLTTLLADCVQSNLALLPRQWRSARADGAAAETALLPAVTRDQVPALLWIATADVVNFALAPTRALARLSTVSAILARCAELRAGYRDASAELLLGTLRASMSRLLGGDDGSAMFASARRLAGDGALLVDVMVGRALASAHNDRALLEATLQRVLTADVGRWPDLRLSNALAVRKARRYLAAESRLLP